MKATILIASTLLFAAPLARGQEPPARATSFGDAASDVRQDLERSLAELAELNARMADEKVPLDRELSAAEADLIRVRQEYQTASRSLDRSTLDLANLRTEIGRLQEEAVYLSNLLGEYGRNLEAGLHVVEKQRYGDALEAAKLAPENSTLSQQEVYAAQAALLATSLERLEEALGGARFEGTAVDADGLVETGTFVMIGPAALFRSRDGTGVGTAEQRLGSLEPAEVGFGDPDDRAAAARLIEGGEGLFPLDPTLGNAHKIEATEETLFEHVRKGGPVMVPIFALAAAALLVALYKWSALLFLRKPARKRVAALLSAVARRDETAARAEAERLRGPAGRMLQAGVEHMRQPRELVEEVMYEAVLTSRLKLERLLPFIAVSAASAPLLGLLGTVTGIISTFKLITVYGSGDVKTLSGGISEALITTEFGLIVAIPSLLIHAFLSRKVRRVVGEMEATAVSFVNQLAKANAAGPLARSYGSRADADQEELVARPRRVEEPASSGAR